MYLSSYTFSGDPAALKRGIDELLLAFRDDLLLTVVVERPDGIVFYDACPDRPTAEAFWADPHFRAALRAHDLPDPEITGLGEIHASVANVSVLV